MKLLPSIAFSDFSGTAGEVTARKLGERTYLSTRSKQPKKKTPFQAQRRCRFSEITRAYATLTDEQRRGWIEQAAALGLFSTSTGDILLTGHNLFVAINSYRKICGKSQTADAPEQLVPSHYIAVDDIWLTPEEIVYTGLVQSANPNDVLLIEMYPAQSAAATKSWNKTVILTVRPTSDWGDIDISGQFVERFGFPLKLEQLVFMKICWIDSECGYLKWFTMIAREAQEKSLLHNVDYVPRAAVSTSQIIVDDYASVQNFDYEMSPGSKITSNDIDATRLKGYSAGCEFTFTELPDSFSFERSYQLARNSGDYLIQCIEVLIQNGGRKRINLSSRAGIFGRHFETFGTYYVTN